MGYGDFLCVGDGLHGVQLSFRCKACGGNPPLKSNAGIAAEIERMLEKYLAIFRATHNFVFVGTDGETPAMRLGFARQPLTFEDILWPGQRIPRPKRSRRKGRPLADGWPCIPLANRAASAKQDGE